MTHFVPALLITLALLGIAFRDITGRRIHPLAMTLLLLALVAWRLSQRDLAFLPYWVGIAIFWRMRFYQLWDAQVLMALFALWPDIWLLVAICASVAVIVGSVLYWRYRGRLRLLWYWWRGRLRTGAYLPSPVELANGEPISYLFTAAGIAYAWFMGGVL